MCYTISTTTDSTVASYNGTSPTINIDREQYKRDLKYRQTEHLKNIKQNDYWQACLHEGCPECIGTGIRKDGSMCIHNLSCPCPKCSPFC